MQPVPAIVPYVSHVCILQNRYIPPTSEQYSCKRSILSSVGDIAVIHWMRYTVMLSGCNCRRLGSLRRVWGWQRGEEIDGIVAVVVVIETIVRQDKYRTSCPLIETFPILDKPDKTNKRQMLQQQQQQQ